MPRRLDSLTALRFPAAAAVVACHSEHVTGVGDGLGRLQAAVTVFFVLSGFVITWGCLGMDWRTFYRRRVARIVPLYMAACLLGLVVGMVVAGDRYRPLTLVSTATLTQAWFPVNWTLAKVDVPVWSLSVEAFFYLVFPLVGRRLARLPRRQRRVLLVCCVAFTALWSLGIGSSAHPSDLTVWATGVLPVVRLPEFLAGALLCFEVRDGFRVGWPMALTALVVAVVGAQVVPAHSFAITGLAVGPAALLVAAGASHDLAGRRVPKLAVEVGAWGYALFLLHYPILEAVGVRSMPVAVATLVGTVLVAGAAYHFLERPLERRLRQGTPKVPAWPPGRVEGVESGATVGGS